MNSEAISTGSGTPRIDWEPTLILYHGECPDGFTAAWVARRALPDVRILGCRHGEEPPPVAGERVMVLDFSYPPEPWTALRDQAEELILLDHHVSAQRNLETFPECFFDLERSGATLSWDHFFPGQPRPRLVAYVEDRDLWRYRLEKSWEVGAWIRSFPMDLPTWDMISDRLENDLDAVFAEGGAILRAQRRTVEIMARQVRRRRFAGYDDVAVINASAHSSELGNELAKTASFAIIWRELEDGRVACELRGAAHSPDLSELATRMGGGGHARAAGFRRESVEAFRELLGPLAED